MDVHIVRTYYMRDLPRSWRAKDGSMYFLAAAFLCDLKMKHGVAALLDASGEPRIVLDSNMVIWDTPWFPEIRYENVTADMNPHKFRFNLFEVIYVSETLATTRPVRCGFTVLPRVTVDASTCRARYRNMMAKF